MTYQRYKGFFERRHRSDASIKSFVSYPSCGIGNKIEILLAKGDSKNSGKLKNVEKNTGDCKAQEEDEENPTLSKLNSIQGNQHQNKHEKGEGEEEKDQEGGKILAKRNLVDNSSAGLLFRNVGSPVNEKKINLNFGKKNKLIRRGKEFQQYSGRAKNREFKTSVGRVSRSKKFKMRKKKIEARKMKNEKK